MLIAHGPQDLDRVEQLVVASGRGELQGGEDVRNKRWRLIPASANGQPALAGYPWDEQTEAFMPFCLYVLSLREILLPSSPRATIRRRCPARSPCSSWLGPAYEQGAQRESLNFSETAVEASR